MSAAVHDFWVRMFGQGGDISDHVYLTRPPLAPPSERLSAVRRHLPAAAYVSHVTESARKKTREKKRKKITQVDRLTRMRVNTIASRPKRMSILTAHDRRR